MTLLNVSIIAVSHLAHLLTNDRLLAVNSASSNDCSLTFFYRMTQKAVSNAICLDEACDTFRSVAAEGKSVVIA